MGYNYNCSTLCLIHPVATWVGGGSVLGTSEMTYTPSMGLISALTYSSAYSLSFIFGELHFNNLEYDKNIVVVEKNQKN